jgi:hypothetical protein
MKKKKLDLVFPISVDILKSHPVFNPIHPIFGKNYFLARNFFQPNLSNDQSSLGFLTKNLCGFIIG